MPLACLRPVEPSTNDGEGSNFTEPAGRPCATTLALNVAVKRLRLRELLAGEEDSVGAARREITALWREPRLENDRPALGRARDVELPADGWPS